MYQRHVSRRPWLVPATISCIDRPGSAVLRSRLSIAGVAAPPPTDARVVIRFSSVPSRSQFVGRRADPLSKTEDMLDEDVATLNGQHCRPGAVGSLRSVSGSGE